MPHRVLFKPKKINKERKKSTQTQRNNFNSVHLIPDRLIDLFTETTKSRVHLGLAIAHMPNCFLIPADSHGRNVPYANLSFALT